jgi:hypothetical protein
VIEREREREENVGANKIHQQQLTPDRLPNPDLSIIREQKITTEKQNESLTEWRCIIMCDKKMMMYNCWRRSLGPDRGCLQQIWKVIEE